MLQVYTFHFRRVTKMAFLFSILSHSGQIFAQQTSVIPPNVRATNTIDRLIDSNGLGTNEMMLGIPLPQGKVIGDTYLTLEWKRTAILLYDGGKLIEGHSARYDIQSNELDINSPSGVKALAGIKIKSFVWLDSISSKSTFFVNAKEYRYNDTNLNGFFEVCVDGSIPLFKYTTLTIKKADYNVALNTGSRDDKILKRIEYYYSFGNQAMLVPNSKKKLLVVFEKEADKVNQFIEDHSLSIKKEDHLEQIFTYYNSLTTPSGK